MDLEESVEDQLCRQSIKKFVSVDSTKKNKMNLTYSKARLDGRKE